MVVMQELLMNGFIKTISQIKHVLHIKQKVMIMVLDAVLKLNAKTVCQPKDVGLKKEPRFMELMNMMMSKVK